MNTARRPRIALVTFGDGGIQYHAAARRLCREARESDRFSEVQLHSWSSLSTAFTTKHRQHVLRHPRGFGLWIWKPEVVRSSLLSLGCDRVVYLDAGSTINLNPASMPGWRAVVDEAMSTPILAFEMRHHLECAWTKSAVFDALTAPNNVTQTPQRLGGYAFFDRSAESLGLIDEWQRLCEANEYQLLLDAGTDADESVLLHHRHDQSLFSCLTKLGGYPALEDETWHEDWSSSRAQSAPIWTPRHCYGTRFRGHRKKSLHARAIEIAQRGLTKYVQSASTYRRIRY